MASSDEGEINFMNNEDKHQPSRLKGALTFRSKEVGRYRLGKTLGKGSCAVVKLGIHRDTGKHAAVKILKPRTLREQKEVLREVEALQRLNHPNITRLHQVIRENGYTCIILELSAGGELFDYVMNTGKLDEEEARFIFRQILSGLQYCHANLVAHRDLKPENLLMDEYGNIKISDFGLSNVLKPGRLFSTWCGSPVYTPPEVVLRQQYNGVTMDVWSLGVVLYVLVTGGMPWRLESNVVKNMDDLIVANYDIPDFLGVSDDCRELISMMLLANSADRASLETIMNHKWTLMGFGVPPDPHLEPKPLVQHVNEAVLEQLLSLGYCPLTTREDLRTKSQCPALTAYHLLLAKHIRAQKVKSCQVNDASLVSSPAQFLSTVTRTRSGTYPTPPPVRSPLAYRKEVDVSSGDIHSTTPTPAPPARPHAATFAGHTATASEGKKGIFRSFLEKFKFSSKTQQQQQQQQQQHQSKKNMFKDSSSPAALRRSPRPPRPVTMIVEHHSPKASPTMMRRRL